MVQVLGSIDGRCDRSGGGYGCCGMVWLLVLCWLVSVC